MKKICLAGGILLAVFNVWHSSMRGVWNGSVLDSLNIGLPVAALARKTDPDIPTGRKSYDGQYYYAMAFDPLLVTKEALPFIDNPRYRYRRMLYPLLARAAAWGDRRALPYALFGLNVLAYLSLGWAAWVLARRERLPVFWAVFGTMGITGVTFSTFRTLPEGMALMWVLWGCYFWRQEKAPLAAFFFALAGLARENALITPLALAGWGFLQEKRSGSRTAWFLSASLLPFIFWWLYVIWRVPGGEAIAARFFTWPFAGMWRETADFLGRQATNTERLRTLSLTFATFLMSVAAWFGLKRPSLWGVLASAQALFCVSVQQNIWDHHAGSSRLIVFQAAFTLLWLLTPASHRLTTVPSKLRITPGPVVASL